MFKFIITILIKLKNLLFKSFKLNKIILIKAFNFQFFFLNSKCNFAYFRNLYYFLILIIYIYNDIYFNSIILKLIIVYFNT